MRSDGTVLRVLTDSDGENARPVWSPDARRIAFVSSRDTVAGERRVGQLYVMNADGSSVRRLTQRADGYIDGSIDWSPDGSRIVYVCRQFNDFQEQLCVIGADGTGRRVLLPAGWRAIDPAWSPDGRTIAFSGWEPTVQGYLHLWGVVPEGGAPRLLSVARNNIHEQEPAWSPDGSRLAFLAQRPRPPFGAGLPEVFTMRVDGTERRPLIADMSPLSSAYSARWSADGARIAFGRNAPGEGLYIVNADGTAPRRIETDAFPISHFSWTGR
jgi:TolB protein